MFLFFVIFNYFWYKEICYIISVLVLAYKHNEYDNEIYRILPALIHILMTGREHNVSGWENTFILSLNMKLCQILTCRKGKCLKIMLLQSNVWYNLNV